MAGKLIVSPDPAATIYFGFGSNIWKEQVKTRCPTSEYLGIARLPGYRWFIAAQGGANIIKGSECDEVWGMAYRLQPRDEEELDILERVPTHFVKEIIEAQLWEPANDGQPADPTQTPRNVGMLVYISHERTAVGQPRAEYVVRMNRAIESGLKEGIPSAYIDNVLRKFIPPGDVQ
jgi:gamma-glutamylcyclotransferase